MTSEARQDMASHRPMHNPLRLAVFGSGTGSNLEAVLRARTQEFIPHYDVVAIFTDRQCKCHDISKKWNIPLIYHSHQKFMESWQHDIEQGKRAYDAQIVEALAPFEIDFILFAGYMRIVTYPLLRAYAMRILNVHPGDLTVEDECGRRRYTGSNAVYDALMAGETKTRSCLHYVDSELDHGTLLTVGPWVEYTEGYPITPQKAKLHQEKQKVESDWPAVISGLARLAEIWN